MADPQHRPSSSTLRQLAALAGAGIQFAVTVALCTAAGWWLDGYLESSPWLLMAGGIAGSVAAFYQLYRTLVDVDEPHSLDKGK